MIESHETARKAGQRAKLEPIDMARRGLHNEAAEIMMERMEDKIEMDMETARRFFTLIDQICGFVVRAIVICFLFWGLCFFYWGAPR